jgi:hypothetical protein
MVVSRHTGGVSVKHLQSCMLIVAFPHRLASQMRMYGVLGPDVDPFSAALVCPHTRILVSHQCTRIHNRFARVIFQVLMQAGGVGDRDGLSVLVLLVARCRSRYTVGIQSDTGTQRQLNPSSQPYLTIC